MKIFVAVAVGGLAYFVWGMVRAARSPEFKRDLERLREQRAMRKAARRKRKIFPIR